MGIIGLLPALKSITKHKNIRDYAGQSIAIDGYCWLHQAAYTCAADIAFNRSTTKLI
jgi:exonuclease-1